MPKGRVSEVLAADALKEIVAAVATIKRRLPFLLALSKDKRMTMLKLGPKSVKFVSDVKKMAQENPDLVAPAYDLPEFIKDVELVEAIDTFLPQLSAVTEGSGDTRMVAGSEAMTTSLLLYEGFKTAKKIVPGLKGALDEMGGRFKRRGGKRKQPKDPNK